MVPDPNPPAPSSVTHVHLLAAIRAELQGSPGRQSVRLLDAGCGNCGLIEFLQRSFVALDPALHVELYGFDISDPHVQESDFLAAGVRRLREFDPNIPWADRTASVVAGDPWPFESGFFDVVVSNQVLEHVADHGHFFSELRRVLRPNAVGLHCFPVEECLWEGHLGMPIVHRVRGHHQRQKVIEWFSLLGFGRHRPARTGLTRVDFAERHADYLNRYTNYTKARDLLHIAKAARLRGTFSYSAGLYEQKLRMLLRLPLKHRYGAPRAGAISTLLFWILKHVSSVTLRVQRSDTYREHYR